MAKNQTATLKYLKIAPRKVRLIADLIRGLPVSEAEAQLLVGPQRATEPMLKLLRSAVANAKEKGTFDTEKLFVSKISVDGGPVLKRTLPRAQGRATLIRRRMSHIVLELAEGEVKNRFTITKPEKKVKKKKEVSKDEKKPKDDSKEEKRKPEKASVKAQDSGVFKRMFKRKSV